MTGRGRSFPLKLVSDQRRGHCQRNNSRPSLSAPFVSFSYILSWKGLESSTLYMGCAQTVGMFYMPHTHLSSGTVSSRCDSFSPCLIIPFLSVCAPLIVFKVLCDCLLGSNFVTFVFNVQAY